MPYILLVRIKKIIYVILHKRCWRAIIYGVAPAIEHKYLLRELQIDGVIDVGANRGQFSQICHIEKHGMPIVAFEPIPKEANLFRRVHKHNKNIELIECALGDFTGTATMHLSQSTDSSSLLPIGVRQNELFPKTAEVGTLSVPIYELDEMIYLWKNRCRLLLKIDVQGSELNVLKGGLKALSHCAFVYVECSEVVLYDGQALRPEVESLLINQGFQFVRCYNMQFDGAQLIQADYLFARK